MDNKQIFREAQYGMMIHFGLYSLLGGEWRGKRIPYIAEWAQSYFKIPNAEYHALANIFNPVYFNADEYARVARDAGMKYMVVTSKHHDGFALFHSQADKFNVVDATPFKRDIIGELAEACYKYGLKLGLYYSQELDWSHPHGGGYRQPIQNHFNTSPWSNSWDFTDEEHKDYSICLEEKILPQLRELMTNYGDIFLIWCDTPFVITPEQSRRIFDLIKHYQPDCLVNSRIGNGMGDYVSAEDNMIPDKNEQKLLYETPATLNDTWGFKYFDDNWKSPEEVARTRNHLKEIGANYLLNIGPDHLGRLPAPAVDIILQAAKL